MNPIGRTIQQTRSVFVIQLLFATAVVISMVRTHGDSTEKAADVSTPADSQPVAVNPHQYNTVADYDRWKLTTDTQGKEVGVWSGAAAATAPADEPSQEAPRTKRSIPGIAIVGAIMLAAAGMRRLTR